jgi:predicted DNA-binding transcriptional regulator YafY
MRTYRVSRVQSAALTDEPCARPPDFDLAAYWAQSTAQFKAHLPHYAATIRADPAILPDIRQGGHYTRIEREYPPDAEGRIRLDLNLEEEHNAVGYLIGFGAQVEVLEPPTLREKIVEIAKEIIAVYSRTSGPTAGQEN